ncbi:leucine-rich repeat domain-containing protein [Bacteroides sp. OttesenSCG-928-F21]|nr:leucine-rich repeat domain-containing protein [Bacteroides sp. OttesenSCG-928-F21]
MDRLDIPAKNKGDQLTAVEFTKVPEKINEIVDALNGSSTVQRKLYVQNNMEKNLAAQSGQPCVLDFTFISQERYSYNDPYENTGERGQCTISIKNSANAEFTDVYVFNVPSNTSQKVDVAEFLTSGANQIKIVVVGEITEETTPAYVYNIQLTSLGISAPNFRWWTAYLNAITLPLVISGNVSKILYVEVTGVNNDYKAEYNTNLGTATYTETAYNYSVPHPGIEGVYTLRAWLTNADGTLQTRAISFEIMCALSLNLNKLLCINNKADQATNWTENILFDYAIHDGQATTTSATFRIKKENTVVFESVESSIPTNTKQTFSFPMEIETDDDSNFEIEVTVTDEEQLLTSPITFPVLNSAGYSAVAGAVFFMNSKTRTNTQANRQNIINEATGEIIPATWSGMNWSNDGWQADASGTRVLRLLAGSKMEMQYKPFAQESAGTGKTLEFDIRCFNVVDGSIPVIDISSVNPINPSTFIGLRIAPDEIFMHSQNKVDDVTQSLFVDEEVRLRITVTIMPTAYGNQGFNLVHIFVDGGKNRAFNYENNDYFAQQGNIVIGSDYADIDVYAMRVYDSALPVDGALKNYINLLATKEEKDAESARNDVMDATGQKVDFDKSVGMYDVFTFSDRFPNLLNPAALIGVFERFFAQHPELNFFVTYVNNTGQGTSSMRYLVWNQRYRTDKSEYAVTYYSDGTMEVQKFDLCPGKTPKVTRATAKKNFASSMQDHKCGAVNAFTDIFKKLGYTNVAIEADPLCRVSVFQQPVLGFSKILNEEGVYVREFQGLYTIGPDKGDSAIFGFDKKKYPELIAVEGADNAPLAALFMTPWTPDRVAYNEEEESWQEHGANSWDFMAGKETNIDRWIEAYNFVYSCSPRLRPYNGTLDELNADVLNYRSTTYEYWVYKEDDLDCGNLYFYEATLGRFVPSDVGSGQINLFTQLVDKGYGLTSTDIVNKTADELNALFIKARIERFRQGVGNHYNVLHLIFHDNFVEFYAATDNLAKNTYFYSHRIIDLISCLQDDLDSIIRSTNQGEQRKQYYVEVGDKYDNNQPVWNGENSNLWNLLRLAFPEEIKLGMRSMFSAMEELSGTTTGTPAERVYAFYAKYHLSVKNYFPPALFNADSKLYEDAKLLQMSGDYTNDTDPLTQLNGNAYSSETAWMKKRIQYMMSKYSYGTYSANSTDIIVVRAAGNEINYDLTPAIWMYPGVASGTSVIRGNRTAAGETCRITVDLGGSADQQNAILGASWLRSIGAWHDKSVSGTMIIQGRRLQEITLGHATEDIVISISALTISNCPSVRLIDLRRIATLSGTLNLASCIHLEELYCDGTSLAQVNLPSGGGLKKINYPATNAYLTLKNFPLLTAENVDISLCSGVITDFFIQDCEQINPIDLLVSVLDAQEAQGASHALKRVRAVGFDATYTTGGSDILDKLALLANGEYVGLNSDGIAEQDSLPVIDGKLTIYADVYEDSVNAIREAFPKLNLTVVGEYYVRFKDAEFQRLVVNKWGNGVGVRQSDLNPVTDLGYRFAYNNLLITDLSDFGDKFPNINMLNAAFSGCSNLKKFSVPKNVAGVRFYGGPFSFTSLAEITNLEYVYSYEGGVFAGTQFEHLTIPTSIIHGKTIAMAGSFVNNCLSLKTLEIKEGFASTMPMCYSCTSLEKIILPESTTQISGQFLHQSGNPKIVICKATVPPSLPSWGSNPNVTALYVPDASVDLYKSATTWISQAAKIFPLSQYTGEL